jgi:hypothetical protein
VRFCACVREISKQSQVSPKAHHTRCLLLLKKSCHKELLHFYAQQNTRHCSCARTATTSRPGTSALQPPLRRCILTPGEIRRCSHVCAATMSRPGTLALQLPLRCCISMPGKMPGMQPCVHRRHITPEDIGAAAAAAPLRLDSWRNPGAAAMCAPPPHHARGHQAAAS